MGSIGINYFATKTKMIPNEFADDFKTEEGRKNIIEQFGDEPNVYFGKNEDGEGCLVTLFKGSMQITTLQNNGCTRRDIFDSNGIKIEEEFLKKWKTKEAV